MIYTCTCNPSLDYYLTFDSIVEGETNRSTNENYNAGGKGINVSIVLDKLNIKSCALGFLGGFTKEYYLSFLYHYKNIQPLFTTIKDNTRIDIKLRSGIETSLNAIGPNITDDEFDKFKARVNGLYPDDVFVVSGNVQEKIEDKMIELIKEALDEGIKVVLDTNKNIIDKCLDMPISLIRVSDEDIEGDVLEFLKRMHSRGNVNILYFDDNKTYFVSDKIYTYEKHIERSLNNVGVADSMVAGYVYSANRGATPLESFKYAIACGTLNGLNNHDDYYNAVEELFLKVEVKEL